MGNGSFQDPAEGVGIWVFHEAHGIEILIEDMKVVPHYLSTEKMIADIGTKALDPKQFCLLRNKLCGYAEWEDDLV